MKGNAKSVAEKIDTKIDTREDIHCRRCRVGHWPFRCLWRRRLAIRRYRDRCSHDASHRCARVGPRGPRHRIADRLCNRTALTDIICAPCGARSNSLAGAGTHCCPYALHPGNTRAPFRGPCQPRGAMGRYHHRGSHWRTALHCNHSVVRDRPRSEFGHPRPERLRPGHVQCDIRVGPSAFRVGITHRAGHLGWRTPRRRDRRRIPAGRRGRDLLTATYRGGGGADARQPGSRNRIPPGGGYPLQRPHHPRRRSDVPRLRCSLSRRRVHQR